MLLLGTLRFRLVLTNRNRSLFFMCAASLLHSSRLRSFTWTFEPLVARARSIRKAMLCLPAGDRISLTVMPLTAATRQGLESCILGSQSKIFNLSSFRNLVASVRTLSTFGTCTSKKLVKLLLSLSFFRKGWLVVRNRP